MTKTAPFRISARYLLAVGVIYGLTSLAWLYLGHVTTSRTFDRDERLREEVGQLWGNTHHHQAPIVTLEPSPIIKKCAAAASVPRAGTDNATADGKEHPESTCQTGIAAGNAPQAKSTMSTKLLLEPTATVAKVDLQLEHRRRGLLWYSTYTVTFDGTYRYKNTSAQVRHGRLSFTFPTQGMVFDEFVFQQGKKEIPFEVEKNSQGQSTAVATVSLQPQEELPLQLRYTSRGQDAWHYSFGGQTARLRNFQLLVSTNFRKIDFPGASLSPSHKVATANGWRLSWQFGNLLSDASIGLSMPQRLNPGPLAAEISSFAPVSLAFFFAILMLVSVLRQVRLHPVHYALLAAAFFSFHLLLAYLVDLIPLSWALSIASCVSVLLVVSYLRLAVGGRFALFWAGGAQLVYLVLFSLAFCLEGYTGLTITVFSVITLFLVMQLTGRIDWSTKFGQHPPQSTATLFPRRPPSELNGLPSPQAPPPATSAADAFTRVG